MRDSHGGRDGEGGVCCFVAGVILRRRIGDLIVRSGVAVVVAVVGVPSLVLLEVVPAEEPDGRGAYVEGIVTGLCRTTC